MARRKTSTSSPLVVIPVVVADQDEALRFYTEKLGLEKRADMTFGPGMRWLTVAPEGQSKPEIALTRPERVETAREHELTGRQRPAGVFDTNDCCALYETLLARGVTFLRPPTLHMYGLEAQFVDPYGNVFSLLEPPPEAYALFRLGTIDTAA